jgi:outer membrane lipopolysaccharide assembly protein LptE/RlpB
LRRERILLAAALATTGLAGCGYHVAGQGNVLPPDVKTVAVPVFINQSKQFRIEQKVSAEITRQLIERTRYKVVPNPEEADAVIQGTVKDVETGVIAFNLSTGAATALQVVVTADVRLVDRHTHKTLFSNPKYVFREEYQISTSATQLFQEEDPALTRLSQDFARTLVTDILENF